MPVHQIGIMLQRETKSYACFFSHSVKGADS
jgi:hypothetical protein